MAQFKKKEIDVLVATTVVEVGLDVHNATVMLIEHAERFGIAQLHQLRGRVGRGLHQGNCILIHALGKIPPYSQQMPLKIESSRSSADEIVLNSQGRRSPDPRPGDVSEYLPTVMMGLPWRKKT